MQKTRTYRNGGYGVIVRRDGTKIRVKLGHEPPVFPESIDLKITNYCVGAPCAQWCHESSNRRGKHSDPEFVKKVLAEMVRGSEVAIGGGNTLAYPHLREIVDFANKCGVTPNITVNEFHADQLENFADLDIGGLGLSLAVKPNVDRLNRVLELFPNKVVFHIINEVHKQQTISWLGGCYKDVPLLILGFKSWGQGATYGRDNYGFQFYSHNPLESNYNAPKIIALDNLAIGQTCFFDELPDHRMYLGADGDFSMYIDAVKEEFAKTSYSPNRQPVAGSSVREMFATIRCLEALG